MSHLIYDTWQYTTPDPDDETEVEYIRKDALLKWAQEKFTKYVKLQNENNQDPTHWGQRNAFRQMIDKLNSM